MHINNFSPAPEPSFRVRPRKGDRLVLRGVGRCLVLDGNYLVVFLVAGHARETEATPPAELHVLDVFAH